MRVLWFVGGVMVGFTAVTLSFGSIPDTKEIVNDGVVYRGALSEIRTPKAKHPNFDRDLKRLSRKEALYRERLPDRLNRPMKRIKKRRYSAKPRKKVVAKRRSSKSRR